MFEIERDWSFERTAVAQAFDTHVREQLPWYDLATNAVAHVARHYISHGGIVYDVGASTGNIGRAIAETLVARDSRLVGIESAAEMAAMYDGPGDLVIADATTFEFESCDLIVAFLALMFVAPHARPGLVERMLAAIRPGGALVVFDKREMCAGYIGTVLARLTLAGKVAANVAPARIVAKELSLAGVQRPIDADRLLPGAVEFFRFGEFSGWILESPS